MRNNISTKVVIIISLVFFTGLALFVPSFSQNNQIEVLLGATTFIYGVIVAFYISFSTNRLNEVGQVLNSEDATFVSIYRIAQVFGEEKQKKLQGLLDNLLISSIDYHLRDYDKTAENFKVMSDFVINLKPETEAQVEAYSILLGLIQQNQHNRTRIIALIKQGLFFYEWLVLIVLNSVVIFCIFYLNNHSIASIIISTFLATSTIILLFILRDLTNLAWKEQVWIWDSLKQTFNEIELIPYYPLDTIKEGRAKPSKGDRVRVATYSNVYPNFTGKKVEQMVIK